MTEVKLGNFTDLEDFASRRNSTQLDRSVN
jgi:hypothetical protein